MKFQGRYALLGMFFCWYLLCSTVVRISLTLLAWNQINSGFLFLMRILFSGLYFDIGVALFFAAGYTLYLLAMPSRFIGSAADRFLTFLLVAIMVTVSTFAFVAEFPFWGEFASRFNFIAVDYLIYTFEVVSNINESYPLPAIIALLVVLVALFFYLAARSGVLRQTFQSKIHAGRRIVIALLAGLFTAGYSFFVRNVQAEGTGNRYNDELGKNGVYSFFAAYRSNELDYHSFYASLPDSQAYRILKKDLLQSNQSFLTANSTDIRRHVTGGAEARPNIILVTIESFSAEFMQAFGNAHALTPNIDRLADEGLLFTKLYATGTRTVRGMEALTLCVPPSPGNSIVRRPANDHLFSIGTVLESKNYHLSFLYGGDGYFDNMNAFFGGQDFDIIDRDRGNPLSEHILTSRYAIPDSLVTFENAWGVCDEDIYSQAARSADRDFARNRPFFQFIMTTSNHRPYTFPENRIEMPQGNRESAVRYTDYALGKFIESVRSKPWFAQTVFVIVADHCASSAGKWEVNIDKHHIPAVIYNLPGVRGKAEMVASQIDLMPTLFGLLKWNYETEFYGKDVFLESPFECRAFMGNYRTLGVLRNGVFTQVEDTREVTRYKVEANGNLVPLPARGDGNDEKYAISIYQTASERFDQGLMKTDPKSQHSVDRIAAK